MDRIVTVIPVYNGERFLQATLESVARQTRRPDRLVVIDDCSIDRTRELVRNFSEFPCELRQNETRQGLFGNLNRALDVASEADCLHVLLADDLVLPEFIEKVMRSLEGIAAPALAFSLTESVDLNGHRSPNQPPNPPARGPRHLSLLEFLRRQCELSTVFCGSIILKTGGKPSPAKFRTDMPQTGDCVFYAEFATHCTERIEVQEVLCQIRHHPFSTTSQNVRKVETWVMDEWKAISAISEILDRRSGAGWLYRQKLNCLFAARSHVKVEMTRQKTPEFAREIRSATLKVVQPHHWLLGGVAVQLRALMRKMKGSSASGQLP